MESSQKPRQQQQQGQRQSVLQQQSEPGGQSSYYQTVQKRGCDHRTFLYPPYNRAPSDGQVTPRRLCNCQHQSSVHQPKECLSSSMVMPSSSSSSSSACSPLHRSVVVMNGNASSAAAASASASASASVISGTPVSGTPSHSNAVVVGCSTCKNGPLVRNQNERTASPSAVSMRSRDSIGSWQLPQQQQTTLNACTAAAAPPSYENVGAMPAVTLVTPETSWTDVRVSVDLLTAAQREANFLRMIDRKASVLYDEQYVQNAVRRYEQYWLPLQAKLQDLNIVPPLDVHWVWHTHMLAPQHYQKDCMAMVGVVIDHRLWSPEEIQERYEASVKAWESFCPTEPYDFVASVKRSNMLAAAAAAAAANANANAAGVQHPPPAAVAVYVQRSTYDIAAAIQRQRNFNYQISLPHYTSPKFLAEAMHRYMKFLFLKMHYPDEFLTPCYDFDVVWHSHQVHPSIYAQDTQRLFNKLLKHDDSVNDRTTGSKLLCGEAMTKKLWAHHFPGEAYWRRGAMYRGHWAPSFLGFEQQDLSNITYGNVHIPCITLKEIPVQRDQLKLKLSYGSKKVTTFNADLSNKDATKDGFCLVWQPAENGYGGMGGAGGGLNQNGGGGNGGSSNSNGGHGSINVGGGSYGSVVHFPFERRHPKELVVELELYDKLFLQKKDLVRLIGRSQLEDLLPPSNSRAVQNVAQLALFDKDGGENVRAKVGITTTLSLTRELQLSVGEFVQRELPADSRLMELCKASALSKAPLFHGGPVKAWVAAHGLVDARDGVQYTVQILHSAPSLLSMVLVFGRDQRLLALAHLVGPDALPSRDQLDPNLQFLPHLSAADERAMVVMNKDGDFAIIKARWVGFQKRVAPAKGGKGKPGNPGKLTVEAFNLLKNTVQKFDLPGPEGTTMFMLGDAQARLPGKRIQCRSTYMAEHIASIFSVAILFVLCNPDKIRSRSENTSVGLQCQKWPLIVAAGYGKENPSNRYLIAAHQPRKNSTGLGGSSADDGGAALWAMPAVMDSIYDHLGFGMMACGDSAAGACGACGACGGCGACGACGGCGSCGGCGGCGGCG